MSDDNTTQHNIAADELKVIALAKHLDIEPEDVEQSDYDDCVFETDGEEYLVYTDAEADDSASDYIMELLWAFNAEFIIEHSKLPYEATDMITGFQESKCEDANDTIAALITDMDEFIEDAIGADGRGHLLNSYDGEEYESQGFYIYQR